MILISYDIANDKLRSRFSKYILKYGHRLQYSVYEIDNGPRFLDTLMSEIENRWEPHFGEDDSVLILKLSQSCDIKRYGYAKHEDESIIIV